MLPIKVILHPTDFSACSVPAFHLASSLARDYKARLVVLHVTSVPDAAYEGYGAPGSPLLAEEYLSQESDSLQRVQPDPAVPIERLMEEGDPPTEILRIATQIPADLIVMGTHGRTGLLERLMGSVAEKVVRLAPCPVVTVKAPARK
jgi:nucleotide-binding universal stress UspA family protein